MAEAQTSTFSIAGAPAGGAPAETTNGAAAAAGAAGAAGANVPDAGKPIETPKADDAAKAATDEQGAKEKAEADKKAADEQAANEAAAKALLFDGVADLKLPDGTMVDEPMAKEFTEWAKANKFTKVQAQQAADLHLKTLGAFAQKLQADAQAQVKAWGEEIYNDKELGGGKVAETVATAEKFFALAKNVPGVNVTRLQADMLRTGMANHPDMIRVARYIGLQVGDDNLFIADRSNAGASTDMASRWYKPLPEEK